MLYDKTNISQTFYAQAIITSSRVTGFNKITIKKPQHSEHDF
jgi:hypothetical protein